MKRRRANQLFLLLSSLAFVFIGISVIIWKLTLVGAFHIVTTVALFSLSLMQLGTGVTQRPFLKKGLTRLAAGIVTAGMGAMVMVFHDLFQAVIPILFAVYVLLLGVIRLIIFAQDQADENRWAVLSLLAGVVMIFFAMSVVLHPYRNLPDVMNFIGVFLILYGVTLFSDFVGALITFRHESGRRRLRVTLPVVWEMFIPRRVLTRVNQFLQRGDDPNRLMQEDGRKGRVDLEIFIHVRESGTGAIGHADLWFEGKVYSYGCYDSARTKMGGLYGDGVLFILSDREKYIAYCQEVVGKTLFAFGLQLDEQQRESVRERLEEVKSHLVPWDPPAAAARKAGESGEGFTDYPSILCRMTDAQYYKFRDTSYKTYFTVTTNCVKLVDEVIGRSGTDILSLNGIITPGTYYDYLNREYEKQDSMVVTRRVYARRKFDEQAKQK